MKCFTGSCSQDFNHSQLHFVQSEHPIVLNIKLIPKVKDENKEPQKITKLAIGMPGGVDLETDNYDTEVVLKCLQCSSVLDHRQNIVAGLVDSILLAQSAYFVSTIEEWSIDLKTCTHVENLNQDNARKIANKAMAHCQECDLHTNLWLCMICGHLGCGRKYYDGSGGNDHAVLHSQNFNHPVVCKLGTITPEGSASLFCYTCDDDVLDHKLGAHMERLGIDIKTQTKTEKSVQELNLEANLNLTLSKTIEEGKELVPLYGAGFTGMENLGNSCYINAVVQVLFSFPEFIERYWDPNDSQIHFQNCLGKAATCYEC